MANGLAGKWMRFNVASTSIKITRCRSNLRTQLLETTNSESGPNASAGLVAEEFVFGVYGGDVDIDIIYQISDAVYATIQNGSTYAVTIWPSKAPADSAKTITGNLSVETFEFTGEVRGLFTAKVTGKFNGGYVVAGSM